MADFPSVSLYSTTKRLLHHYRALKKNALPSIAHIIEAKPRDLKRITKYWQLGLHVICNAFYELTGKQLSPAEEERILLLSIFSPFYDDLFDEQIMSTAAIETFTLEPGTLEPTSYTGRAVKMAYTQLLQKSLDPARIIRHMHQVFIWQKASLKQLDATASEEELYDITYKKSYYSILLYLSILDHPPSEAMKEALYPMAGLLQLTNDLFDVYKDMQAGIFTVPNLYPDFDKIELRFMQDVALFNRLLWSMPYADKHKTLYSITIHALNGMGRMALRQLKRNSAGKKLSALTRKELVCDMDPLPQKFRWIYEVKSLANHS